MTKKIAVIDATKVSLAPVEAAAKQFPDVEIFHLMDEGMSYLAKRDGRITGANMGRCSTCQKKPQLEPAASLAWAEVL